MLARWRSRIESGYFRGASTLAQWRSRLKLEYLQGAEMKLTIDDIKVMQGRKGDNRSLSNLATRKKLMPIKTLKKDAFALMDGRLVSELMNLFILPADWALRKNILVESTLDASSISIIEIMHSLLFVREILTEYD
ncbi:hypothetical protein COCNU_scaffold091003G000010 [Cocos nucifera]|nr:hypothetical protein [Cocos nucifera]